GTSRVHWQHASGMLWRLPCAALREINQKQPDSSASRRVASITNYTNIDSDIAKLCPETCNETSTKGPQTVYFPAPAIPFPGSICLACCQSFPETGAEPEQGFRIFRASQFLGHVTPQLSQPQSSFETRTRLGWFLSLAWH